MSEAALSTRIRFVHKDDFTIKKNHPLEETFGLTAAPQGHVILMFKVSGKADSVLNIKTETMLATDVPTIELDPTFTRPRAWFEVLDSGFAETRNKLTMTLDRPADGQVTVSDVVILYRTA
jgi:hypothetical protein